MGLGALIYWIFMVDSPVKISVNSFLFYAPFTILVCIISLPVCHNMGDYHCFCLPSLFRLTLFSGLSFFLLRLFHPSSAFPPWLPEEGITCTFLAVTWGDITPFWKWCHWSEAFNNLKTPLSLWSHDKEGFLWDAVWSVLVTRGRFLIDFAEKGGNTKRTYPVVQHKNQALENL